MLPKRQESLLEHGPYGLMDQWPINLLGHIEMFRLSACDTALQDFREWLRRGLHWALYLWLWWIYDDGAWRPWDHWGWILDHFAIVQEKIQSLRSISHESPQNFQYRIDEIFQPGRKYFPDSEYEKLPAMFTLFFVLENINYIRQEAMEILENRFLHEPTLQLNTPKWQPGRMWHIDDTRSYTEEEIVEAMEGGENQSEKMKIIKKRQERIQNWQCPDCGSTTESCDCGLPF